MLQICEISCDPLHHIQRYNQLWLTPCSVSIWYLSQNLTHKSAKMCNANMCHLTPQSQVWIPVRRSGAALTSDLWVSHLSVSSFFEHRKSLLGGRKMFTSVKKKLVSAAGQGRRRRVDVNRPWFFTGYYSDLTSVEWCCWLAHSADTARGVSSKQIKHVKLSLMAATEDS